MAARGAITRQETRDGQVDTVDDPEQAHKYQELIGILLAAGYFRARIEGLSPFDKIIGGMAWAITLSDVDVEVDIYFVEEAPLGTKIKMGESIVRALNRMKAPPIQSHQIQGLDFVSLFPVVQWLVKKVMSTRDERGDQLRRYSEAQFNREQQLPSDRAFAARKPQALAFVDQVVDRYGPVRQFRRPASVTPRHEQEQVLYTLLEYGVRHRTSRHVVVRQKSAAHAELEAALGGGGGGDDRDEERQRRAAEEEERELARMMGGMGAAGDGGRVAGAMVGSLVAQSAAQISSAIAAHGEGSAGIALTAAQRKQMTLDQHAHRVEARTKQLKTQQGRAEEVAREHAKLAAALDEKQAEQRRLQALVGKLREEIAKLDALENDDNRAVLQQLRALVLSTQTLAAQEDAFKAACRQQMAELKAKITQLLGGGVTPEEEERRRMVGEAFAADTAALAEMRAMNGKKLRDISTVERLIDDVPPRSELQQYQKQLLELHEQVASKLVETRQFYETYNMNNSKSNYLAKEVSILNSVAENYPAAMKSKPKQQQLLDSLKTILTSLDNSLTSTRAKADAEKAVVQTLTAKYTALLEKEREYARATELFESECARNAQLAAALERKREAPPPK